MDSSRLLAEQDLQDAKRSINELTEALTKQRFNAGRKAKVYHRGVQTKKVTLDMEVSALQENHQQQAEEDFPHFYHST